MRLKIKFKLSGKRQVLPLNYQYPLSAWIYKVLYSANQQFAENLHDYGYKLENGKTFKLFTFSKLGFPKHTWKIIPNSDRMQIWSRNAWLNISFQLPEQIENFVSGLFKNQKAFIGDLISGIELEVESIEAIGGYNIFVGNSDDETITVNFKTVSPIVLGLNTEESKNEQYINPYHKEYKVLFEDNLRDKYLLTGKTEKEINDINFKITKLYPKTELQTIKANTSAETQIRAFHYEFELTAPKEILKLGLNAGFGSMNGLGFGYCEVVEEEKLNNNK